MIKLLKRQLLNLLNYFDLEVINKKQIIVELSNYDKELIELVSKYSMTTRIRIYNLLQALKYVKQKSIKGDFVECGVWKGGNLILFQKFIEKDFKDENRTIFAFDTFEGMNEPDENDFDLKTKISAKNLLEVEKDKKSNLWGVCSLEDVKENILENCSSLKNIKFVKGKVENTLDDLDNLPQKISVLRLDTDWYKSTKKELEVLYDRVSSGGVIIIDDYGHWGGSKKSVDEFFAGKFVWMHYVDYACRLIIKD